MTKPCKRIACLTYDNRCVGNCSKYVLKRLVDCPIYDNGSDRKSTKNNTVLLAECQNCKELEDELNWARSGGVAVTGEALYTMRMKAEAKALGLQFELEELKEQAIQFSREKLDALQKLSELKIKIANVADKIRDEIARREGKGHNIGKKMCLKWVTEILEAQNGNWIS